MRLHDPVDALFLRVGQIEALQQHRRQHGAHRTPRPASSGGATESTESACADALLRRAVILAGSECAPGERDGDDHCADTKTQTRELCNHVLLPAVVRLSN
jgi:hypothetical protein